MICFYYVLLISSDLSFFSREMVHLAIDGMWHVFKLKMSTPINDFCRVAAKNGVLPRLINTLVSLNETSRLAFISGGPLSVDGQAPQARSGQLDQPEASLSVIDQPDALKTSHGGGEEPSHASTSTSQRTDVHQPRLSSVAEERLDLEVPHHLAHLPIYSLEMLQVSTWRKWLICFLYLLVLIQQSNHTCAAKAYSLFFSTCSTVLNLLFC